MVWDARTCPDCGKERLVRRWSNKTGLCRSCSTKRRKPLTQLLAGFIRGEQIGRAPQTIYFKQECPQCHISRWMRANLNGPVAPNRICYRCAGVAMRLSKKRQGRNNGHWRGGRQGTGTGYVKIYCPDHPRAVHRYVLEHILVWEKAHNKSLPKGWIIHHLNGIKDDNKSENLLAMLRRKHSSVLYITALQKQIRKLEEQMQTIVDENCVEG